MHISRNCTIILLLCATTSHLGAAEHGQRAAAITGEKDQKAHVHGAAVSEARHKTLSTASPFDEAICLFKPLAYKSNAGPLGLAGHTLVVTAQPWQSEWWRGLCSPLQKTDTDIGPSARKLLMHNDGARAVAVNAYNYIQILQRLPGDQQPAYRAYTLAKHDPAQDYFCAMSPDNNKLLSCDPSFPNTIKMHSLGDDSSKCVELSYNRFEMTPMPLFFEDNDYFMAFDFGSKCLLSLAADAAVRTKTPLCEKGERIDRISLEYYKLGLQATLETSKRRTLIIDSDHPDPIVIPATPLKPKVALQSIPL